MQTEDRRLAASPYGDIVDVLLTNLSQEVLSSYPVVILASELTPDVELAPKLLTFLRQGGALIIRNSDTKLFPFLKIRQKR